MIVWFGFDLTRRLGGILLSRYVRKFWRVHGTHDVYRQREVNVDARDADSRRFARTLFVRDRLVRRRDIDSYARRATLRRVSATWAAYAEYADYQKLYKCCVAVA